MTRAELLARPYPAWVAALLAGVAAPSLALWRLAEAPVPLALVGGPILALGLMGVGMSAAATAGRLWVGVVLALLSGVGLVLLARALGMPALPHPVSTGFAFLIASLSFAARGALFARSAGAKGWWIAVFVVAGEAAMLWTAAAMPGVLPEWLLVLLPARWASLAVQAALTGPGAWAAGSALLALGGTAAATLLVARLLPRRWPYLIMFAAWLGLSALVWYRPGPPMPRGDPGLGAQGVGGGLKTFQPMARARSSSALVPSSELP